MAEKGLLSVTTQNTESDAVDRALKIEHLAATGNPAVMEAAAKMLSGESRSERQQVLGLLADISAANAAGRKGDCDLPKSKFEFDPKGDVAAIEFDLCRDDPYVQKRMELHAQSNESKGVSDKAYLDDHSAYREIDPMQYAWKGRDEFLDRVDNFLPAGAKSPHYAVMVAAGLVATPLMLTYGASEYAAGALWHDPRRKYNGEATLVNASRVLLHDLPTLAIALPSRVAADFRTDRDAPETGTNY